MVQLPNLGKLLKRKEPAAAKSAAAEIPTVKSEVEDPLEEEHGPLSKKIKAQWDPDAGRVPPQSAQCSLLDEPSPLGLRLRKSPSLLDLIQMKLSQGSSATASYATSSGGFDGEKKKDLKSTAVLGTTDKLKASNFPASFLRIGSWEYVSTYEGDLVAKCYYAKHKLVWEVLDGGLKSKIEIQWSDIIALKANCSENAPGTLDIVLARQPLFFRETNPQPRKHTLWQATSDFTNGQASIHRRHFLQCPPGLLSKHFEKLIQCDPRLNSLSQQPEIILESPYFESRGSAFEDHVESKCHGFDDLKDGFDSKICRFQDSMLSHDGLSPSTNNEICLPIGRTPDDLPQEKTPSPRSGLSQITEENPTTSGTKESSNTKRWDQIKVPGLRSSMSVIDLVNHIGNCISGQTTAGNPLLPTDSSLDKSMLEELTQYLLSDSQIASASASDEQFLMSRVNSLCCLIQPQDGNDDNDTGAPERKALFHVSDGAEEASINNDHFSGKQPSMSRKESYGELLMHLPRIASLPQFLFNIAEDSEKSDWMNP
ncbi:uncharacterized protein A4U43_C01F250 [Asparagus officinalis]|uniref:TRF2/HOY1 PH-like domain-containing protein n=1 Tax=Asparagus officinalis TaxID=4686 RepID=A0A5P1FL86_ASPOF|nr:uncharacterized protein LOC109845008 isoform X2 [Asparagus officinalis]ONK78854.1 uncharacterized protein A4U43_C01F250 [Asparagus officinalis]